ncbi:glycosyltransferase, partial [Paenibacillus sepulcri]|nr:glycosyltransferase [Paenibacillus sepulcri]
IGETPFKQLLYAVMAAVGGKKKVYVALDVPIKQLPDLAKQLLGLLYASLPYAYRRQLGFITYAKEPQSRKSVHLTFVEQGSLRLGDRSIEKDYILDFASGRLMNVDLDGKDQPYLDFAWDNLDRLERADSFYQFAERMLEDMEPERQTAAASYHELCVIYQIEEGSKSLYETHKAAVLHGLLDYLQPTGSLDSKMRLNDLFLSCFDYEFDRVRQGQVPEPFIMDVFKDYYRIDGKHIESKLVSFIILALNNANMQNEQEAAASFYAAVESHSALSRAFFAKLLTDARLAGSLFIPFLEIKLQA